MELLHASSNSEAEGFASAAEEAGIGSNHCVDARVVLAARFVGLGW